MEFPCISIRKYSNMLLASITTLSYSMYLLHTVAPSVLFTAQHSFTAPSLCITVHHNTSLTYCCELSVKHYMIIL